MPKTPDAVVRSWFEEIWNKGREEAIDRLAGDNFIAHGAPSLPSTVDFKVLYRQFRQALSDIEVTVERTVTQGEYCAGYCRVKGRHTGNGFGGAPSIEWSSSTVWSWRLYAMEGSSRLGTVSTSYRCISRSGGSTIRRRRNTLQLPRQLAADIRPSSIGRISASTAIVARFAGVRHRPLP
jgi:hypothetical protein